MEIIITKKVPKRVAVQKEDGERGPQTFKDVIELVPVTFEAHPQELVGSIANRFIKAEKLPEPPKGVVPTLRNDVRGLTCLPTSTLKETGCLVFVIAGLEPRAKA